MSEDPSHRLDELKLLWESDPSSKVYLQLASVYRQKGQLEKAVEVLETSLQHRPRDPRGRVALARCRMELGEHLAAAELLEEVIRLDAAHVEANKQLLECYLQLGDGERAEERLNIYRLLNDRDPELDHLEYRLSSLGDGGEKMSADAEPPQPSETVPAAPEAPRTGFTAGASPAPDFPIAEELEGSDSEAPSPDLEVAAVPEPEPGVSEPDEPELVFEDADVGDADVEDTVIEDAEIGDLKDSRKPAESPWDGGGDLFELPAVATAVDDTWGGDLFDLAPPDAVVDTFSDLGGLWEQTEIVEAVADEDELGDQDESVVVADAASGETTEAAIADDVEQDQAHVATATLGLLYLKQGHLDEAESIFRRVVSRDPDHDAALAGLQQLEAHRAAAQRVEESAPEPASEIDPSASRAAVSASPVLIAQVLLGRAALAGQLPGDVAGRKIAVLKQYTQHIRTASGDHVH